MANLAKQFADNSSGTHVKNAYSSLGPITNFSDVLIPTAVPPPAASDELAAEQTVHLCDGWRYATSAISAFLRNAQAEAIHYAYYAELRAAMSLYAGTGIRIRQGQNYYVDNAGTKHPINPAGKDEKMQLRTHTIAWELWERWVKRSDVSDLVQNGLRISPAVSLRTIIPGLALFSTEDMVLKWGSDLLADPKADKDERNIASYLPTHATKPLSRMSTDDVEFILALCNLLLPAASGLRNSLAFDAILIQWLVQTAIESKVPDTAPDRAAKVEEERVRMIDELSASTGEGKELLSELLIEPDEVQASIFTHAASPATEPRNVISRAIFLLRLATLSVEANLATSPASPVAAWLLNWLDHIGIRSCTSTVAPSDLAEDLQIAIDSHRTTSFGKLPSELWEDPHARNTYIISRADRSVAWSVLS